MMTQIHRRNKMKIKYRAILTDELSLKAVELNGDDLQYVKEQTETVCLAAVKHNGYALRYVKEQTEAVCLAAVKQNGYALQYVKEKTETVCLAAVKQNGVALMYVKEQTEAVCLAAVKQNGVALMFVKEQTEALESQEKVTRLEVIDNNGRSYVNYGVNKMEFSYQDEGRTLKIFTNGSDLMDSQEATNEKSSVVQEPDRTGKVYYKNNACKAKDAYSHECICWTDKEATVNQPLTVQEPVAWANLNNGKIVWSSQKEFGLNADCVTPLYLKEKQNEDNY